MSSKWELDDGIKSIRSAWLREHTARTNLEKMLENAESENTELRKLLQRTWDVFHDATGKEFDAVKRDLRKLGVEVDR